MGSHGGVGKGGGGKEKGKPGIADPGAAAAVALVSAAGEVDWLVPETITHTRTYRNETAIQVHDGTAEDVSSTCNWYI